jgi:hypothetical protein
MQDPLGDGSLAALKELLGVDLEEKRLARVRALSDDELLRAVVLLSDEKTLINGTVLELLRAELRSRGLSEHRH